MKHKYIHLPLHKPKQLQIPACVVQVKNQKVGFLHFILLFSNCETGYASAFDEYMSKPSVTAKRDGLFSMDEVDVTVLHCCILSTPVLRRQLHLCLLGLH